MMTIRFTLDEASVGCFAEVPCPDCGTFLSVHLPDPEISELLLGTCDCCKSWFLIDTDRQEMARLPVRALFDE